MDQKEYAKTVAKNLRRIIYDAGKTPSEVAKDLNINKSTLSCWMNGARIPRMDSIDRLCHYFNCSRADIMEPFTRETAKAVRIPVLGRVAAGIPLEAITDIIDYEEIPTSWPGEYISLQVKGDSMVPVIPDGSVVIVRIQPDAESGEFVVAQINGQDATVKKLLKRTDGITLQPLNPNYEPLFYSEEEKERIPVKIIGKVVEIRIKL